MTILRVWARAALTAVISTWAALGATANPLIWTWHFSGEKPLANMPNVRCQITQMVFTPTDTTAFDPKPNSTLAATYNISAQRAVVMSEGGDVVYFLKDADHIQRDDWFNAPMEG